MIAFGGIRLFQNRFQVGRFHRWLWILRVSGFCVALAAGCGLASMNFNLLDKNLPYTAGGILGKVVMEKLLPAFGYLGSTLLMLSIFLAGITLTTGLSWFGVLSWFKESSLRYLFNLKARLRQNLKRCAEKCLFWKKNKVEFEGGCGFKGRLRVGFTLGSHKGGA